MQPGAGTKSQEPRFPESVEQILILAIGFDLGRVERICLDSQVAGNKRPLYPKVEHSWLKCNYEPLALLLLVIGSCAKVNLSQPKPTIS